MPDLPADYHRPINRLPYRTKSPIHDETYNITSNDNMETQAFKTSQPSSDMEENNMQKRPQTLFDLLNMEAMDDDTR